MEKFKDISVSIKQHLAVALLFGSLKGRTDNQHVMFLTFLTPPICSNLCVKVASTFLSCQIFGKQMIKQKHGSILNISSASAGPPLSKAFAYSAAKSGIKNLTKNLAREWATKGVRVNALRPGFFPTQWSMENFIDKPPHHLSFGQKRKVAIASVLASEPELLVLDEPSSNLDPASRRELIEILKSLKISLILVTHDLPMALELCNRSIILNNGEITTDMKTYEILKNKKIMKENRLELPYGFALHHLEE